LKRESVLHVNNEMSIQQQVDQINEFKNEFSIKNMVRKIICL